ncbi:hypothetical protein ACFZ8E_07435 [Methylobacterium sp. HMF5984]|uniref:hypothetical protein n=1 Tax=Methylobacterium sp. HMF5984 TaxID=3367370 RepID=UPI003851CF3C
MTQKTYDDRYAEANAWLDDMDDSVITVLQQIAKQRDLIKRIDRPEKQYDRSVELESVQAWAREQGIAISFNPIYDNWFKFEPTDENQRVAIKMRWG